jgi:hypothetical protein
MAFRAHLSPKENPKVRPVWIYPFEMILMEAPFVIPLTDQIK